MTAEPTVSVITASDSQRLRLAFSRMPFAADPNVMAVGDNLVRVGSYRDPVTVDVVVNTLDALRSVIAAYVRKTEAAADDHWQLSRDVEAMRRVLGTAGFEAAP